MGQVPKIPPRKSSGGVPGAEPAVCHQDAESANQKGEHSQSGRR